MPVRRYHNGVKVQGACRNSLGELAIVEYEHQVLPDGATDAAVHHLNELLLGLNRRILLEQFVIDADVAKLVLDRSRSNSVLFTVCGSQNMVEQSGLASTQKTSEHRHLHRHSLV